MEDIYGGTDGYCFMFYQDQIVILNGEKAIIPHICDVYGRGLRILKIEEFTTYQGIPCFYGEMAHQTDDSAFRSIDLRSLFMSVDEDMLRLSAQAYHLMNWDRTSQYCGYCSGKTEKHQNLRAKYCPRCGRTIFPRISPAVIVAITKDNKILLARGHRFNFYSLIAGFIEPGETIEEGLKREVREEVGIEIKNLRYFASQPWPFPDSLMIDFTAEYESGELTPDETEIFEAGWFTADEMPMVPGKISIAGNMIEHFRRNKLSR